jgi:hypothetical protein
MSQFGTFDLGACGCAPAACNATVCAVGCNGNSLPGASVSIGTFSGTTDSSGCVTIDVGSAGTYTVTITATGFVTYSASHTVTCGFFLSQTLTVDTGYVCVSCCPNPLPTTLTATWIFGAAGGGATEVFTLTYGGTSWTGGGIAFGFIFLTLNPDCSVDANYGGTDCGDDRTSTIICDPISLSYTFTGSGVPCGAIDGSTLTITL